MSNNLPEFDSVHTVVFDFDGVFTDNKVWVDQEGKELIRCDRGDGLAFDMVRKYQIQGKLDADFFILSKEPNPVVLSRAEKLKLPCHHGIKNKLAFMDDYLINLHGNNTTSYSGVVYLGNDLNDLPVMQQAGYSVAPSDAHPRVQKCADLVMSQKGGEGFVRAFIERLLGIDKLNEEEINELISNC